MVSAVCAFSSVKAAVDTCVQVLQSSIPIARIGNEALLHYLTLFRASNPFICFVELMDDVAMDICNKHNGLDYQVAPTLFLEFHGTEESVTSQAKAVGNNFLNHFFPLFI